MKLKMTSITYLLIALTLSTSCNRATKSSSKSDVLVKNNIDLKKELISDNENKSIGTDVLSQYQISGLNQTSTQNNLTKKSKTILADQTFEVAHDQSNPESPEKFNSWTRKQNIFTLTKQNSKINEAATVSDSPVTTEDPDSGTLVTIKNYELLKTNFIDQKKLSIVEEKLIDTIQAKNLVLTSVDQLQSCKVNLSSKINHTSRFRLKDLNTTLLDKEADVYESVFLIKEEKVNNFFSIICIHTTEDIYLNQTINDFFEYLTFYNLDEKPIEKQNVIKAHSIDLKLKSFKIKNVDLLKKGLFDPITQSGLFFNNGKLSITSDNGQDYPADADLSSQYITAGKIPMACTLRGFSGQLTNDLNFVLVDRGLISSDIGGNIAQTYAVFRANETTKIEINCIILKTVMAEEIINTFKDILDFGVLNRKDFSTFQNKMINFENKQKLNFEEED